MIIFLVLTVLFIIGTVIYLNNKKKNVNAPKHSAETKDKDKSNKKGKKQLTDILQIKIKDNIICLGNRYSNVIKLGNIDYNMLSNSEQDSIENVLIQTALAIDYPIQFFSTTEFKFDTVCERAREEAFLLSGIAITVTDKRGKTPENIKNILLTIYKILWKTGLFLL